MRPLYRLGQLWQAATAGVLPPDAWEQIAQTLSPAELALFQRHSPHDQWHSYHVWQTLVEAGESLPALLKAALLHDIGKTRVPLSLAERSLVVVAKTLLPRTTAVWGRGQAAGWRRPFAVLVQHPAWGAEMVAAAGTDPLTVALIRHHQDPRLAGLPDGLLPVLRRLQWADDRN